MSATIILAGENARACRVEQCAAALGLETAVSAGPDTPELARQAQARGAQGILALTESAVPACARACRELGLPGPSPGAVGRMLDKGLMREALSVSKTDQLRFAVVETPDAVLADAKRLRPPWIVKPATGDRLRGVSFIAHAEDLPLGYKRASAHSRDGRVVIDEYVQGDEFVLDGMVRGGALTPLCLSTRLRPVPPMLHDLGMEAPISGPVASSVIEFGERAVDALGYDEGPVRLELVSSGGTLHTIEASPCLCGGRLETDLARIVGGAGSIDTTLLACIGAELPRAATGVRGAALLWVPARSGIVEEILGLDAARAIPGVVEADITAQAGDWIGHVMIRQTQERIGHVLAEGQTAHEAMAAARLALERCTVVTRPTITVR